MSADERPLLCAALLMDELERAGVCFALDAAGEVMVSAPHSTLTDAHRAALTEHRAGIRELLAIVGPACWQPLAPGRGAEQAQQQAGGDQAGAQQQPAHDDDDEDGHADERAAPSAPDEVALGPVPLRHGVTPSCAPVVPQPAQETGDD